MSVPNLDVPSLVAALALRDLTDPAGGPHAMQELVARMVTSLTDEWRCENRLIRRSPVVPVADNYDRLHIPPDGVVRDRRYTRYVCEGAVLRTQTTSMIPPALRELAAEPSGDRLLSCPGLVYRRDVIDRLHTGEPHQIDLWRIRTGVPMGTTDLEQMVRIVVESALPGRRPRLTPVEHPYTTGGLEIHVEDGPEWVEIGECGLALPALLDGAGMPGGTTGLAMGLGLDRLLMLRKGIPDIRLLRASDPRIAKQMLDLSPYRAVSSMPPVRRDLSLVLDEPATPEEIGDRVRDGLGAEASLVEEVVVIEQTPAAALAPAIVERLGIASQQTNALVRVVLRSLDRTMTRPECDVLRDRIYRALHRGTRWYWAAKED